MGQGAAHGQGQIAEPPPWVIASPIRGLGKVWEGLPLEPIGQAP